ncbi:MAG: hypothetical protein ACREBW_06630 [Candidatus Micrarchaeaceae archaeon]
MIDVSYAPVKKVIIHEIVRIEDEDLLRSRVTPAGNMPLYWCDGVLFTFSSVPMSKEVMKDYLDGTLHWMEMHYTEMKVYQPILELHDEQYRGTQKIRVIDTSKSSIHKDVVSWLKNRKK